MRVPSMATRWFANLYAFALIFCLTIVARVVLEDLLGTLAGGRVVWAGRAGGWSGRGGRAGGAGGRAGERAGGRLGAAWRLL